MILLMTNAINVRTENQTKEKLKNIQNPKQVILSKKCNLLPCVNSKVVINNKQFQSPMFTEYHESCFLLTHSTKNNQI
jgi:esterase/lipase